MRLSMSLSEATVLSTKSYRLARNVGEIVRGAAHVAGDGVEPVRDVGGGVARVQERDVEEVVQLGELRREVLGRGGGEVEREIGLHLSDDAPTSLRPRMLPLLVQFST